jgi:hypothetical protein
VCRAAGFAVGFALWLFAATLRAQSVQEGRSGGPPDAGVAEPPSPLPVVFDAEEVGLDARTQALTARGHVHLDQPPFHFESESLRLKRVRAGVELEGSGRLVFCPCLGAPLAVVFNGATLAPPHDVIVKGPVLQVFGLPVAWLPAFWLRSPGRAGLLPPDLEWRGVDGFFAGGGVHVPWASGDLAHGLDLRAGGYVEGGVALDAALRTTTTTTRIRWDHLHADGLGLEAHGAASPTGAPERPDSVAWDADALRGARAVAATTDVGTAADPFDRAQASVALRPTGWMFASGVRTVALRGGGPGDLGVGGPVVDARRADGIGHVGTFDVTLEGGQLAGAGLGAVSFARAEGGALFAGHAGPVGTSVAVRALGDLDDNGNESGTDAITQLRAAAALPLVHALRSADESDPWVHTTEPRIEGAAVASRTEGYLLPPARGAPAVALGGNEALVAAGGWRNAVGRWGSRTSAEADVIAGLVVTSTVTAPALRARGAAQGDWLGLGLDLARVQAAGLAGSGVVVARVRVGSRSGVHLTAHVAERDGVDPVLARALVDAPLEPASGFLDAAGWTGGGRLAVALGPRVTTTGGTDFDLTTRQLVAEAASLELHDPCNCAILRATVSHRIGRGGVDAWLAVDLPLLQR